MSVARGSALPKVSNPSVRKNCMPPTRMIGRKIIAMKAMPSPPVQFSIPRHRFMPTGCASSPTMTEAPVVVMPDTPRNRRSDS
jgi:hypothetical protein